MRLCRHTCGREAAAGHTECRTCRHARRQRERAEEAGPQPRSDWGRALRCRLCPEPLPYGGRGRPREFCEAHGTEAAQKRVRRTRKAAGCTIPLVRHGPRRPPKKYPRRWCRSCSTSVYAHYVHTCREEA